MVIYPSAMLSAADGFGRIGGRVTPLWGTIPMVVDENLQFLSVIKVTAKDSV